MKTDNTIITYDKPVSLDSIHETFRKITESLIAKNRTITTMESCTSGFIASLITDTEGSSAIFKGADITYSNEAKLNAGVFADVLEKYGVYSIETAAAMAESCRRRFKADIGIGVTGTFANADPNNEDSIPGHCYIAIAEETGIASCEVLLKGEFTRFESKLIIADAIGKMVNLS